LPYVRKTRKHPIHMETKCICAESIWFHLNAGEGCFGWAPGRIFNCYVC
jgi:hypothetical protein